MEYNLHLDDDARTSGLEDFRYPPKDGEDWKIATSSPEAISIVCQYGFPSFMQLDCDLGLLPDGKTPDTSMRFVKWLYAKHPDKMPKWHIHSRNGEATKNLQSYLEGWAKSIDSSSCPDQCFHDTCVEKFLPDASGAQYKHPADCGDPLCEDCNDASGGQSDLCTGCSASINNCCCAELTKQQGYR